MDPETSARHRSGGLETAAARLARRLQASVTAREARQAHLDDLIRDAETWLHRRAAWNDRDKALYRTGAALEPYGGHRLDDIKLGGLDALGSQGVLLLAQTALQYPDQPLSQLIAILFESSHGPSIAEWGRWSRLHCRPSPCRSCAHVFARGSNRRGSREPVARDWRGHGMTRPATPPQAWDIAFAAWKAAKTEEDAYDRDIWLPSSRDGTTTKAINDEIERLMAVREAAEVPLFSLPALNAHQLAMKCLMAFDNGRECTGWRALFLGDEPRPAA